MLKVSKLNQLFLEIVFTFFTVVHYNVSYYACNKMNYSIAFSILLRYTHLKASVYNLFSNNLKINGGRTDSLCFSRNFFKSKEQRDSGSFRPFVKITL